MKFYNESKIYRVLHFFAIIAHFEMCNIFFYIFMKQYFFKQYLLTLNIVEIADKRYFVFRGFSTVVVK